MLKNIKPTTQVEFEKNLLSMYQAKEIWQYMHNLIDLPENKDLDLVPGIMKMMTTDTDASCTSYFLSCRGKLIPMEIQKKMLDFICSRDTVGNKIYFPLYNNLPLYEELKDSIETIVDKVREESWKTDIRNLPAAIAYQESIRKIMNGGNK